VFIALKIAMLNKGVRQTRMAVDLGWDPAKLSRIVNQVGAPSAADRKAIADYLGTREADLFCGKRRGQKTQMPRMRTAKPQARAGRV
jgi:transcriptional regulator with XRE-family HTH domain